MHDNRVKRQKNTIADHSITEMQVKYRGVVGRSIERALADLREPAGFHRSANLLLIGARSRYVGLRSYNPDASTIIHNPVKTDVIAKQRIRVLQPLEIFQRRSRHKLMTVKYRLWSEAKCIPAPWLRDLYPAPPALSRENVMLRLAGVVSGSRKAFR